MKPGAWWALVVLAVVARLALVSSDEILYQTADAESNAQASLFYLTGEAPNDRIFNARPGLALVVRASRSLGIPYKLLLDGLLVVVALGAAGFVRRSTGSDLCAAGVFAVTLFNPWFLENSRFLMTEPIVSLLLLSTGLVMEFFVTTRAGTAWLPGALFGAVAVTATVLTRPETPVVWAAWLGLAGVAAWVWRGESRRRQAVGSLLLAAPLVVALLVSAAIARENAERFGVEALSITEAPELRGLLTALYSVPSDPPVRFSPVTRASFERAAERSPTLGDLRAQFYDRSLPAYRHAEAALGLEGEVGTWLNWHLLNVFGGRRNGLDAMRAATQEIRAAQEAGTLARRWALYPIDPLWQAWLPELPGVFVGSLKASLLPPTQPPAERESEILETWYARDGFVQGVFAHGVLARAALGPERIIHIDGSTRRTGTPIRTVKLRSSADEILATAYPMEATGAGVVGFALRISPEQVRPGGFPLRLELLDSQGVVRGSHRIRKPDAEQRWGEMAVLDGPDPNALESWRVRVYLADADRAAKLALQDRLRRAYPVGFLAIVLLAFVDGVRKRRSGRAIRALGWVLVPMAGLVVARAGYYASIEVLLDWANDRYLGASSLLAAVVVVLAAWWIGAMFQVRKARSEAGETDAAA